MTEKISIGMRFGAFFEKYISVLFAYIVIDYTFKTYIYEFHMFSAVIVITFMLYFQKIQELKEPPSFGLKVPVSSGNGATAFDTLRPAGEKPKPIRLVDAKHLWLCDVCLSLHETRQEAYDCCE